MSKFIRHIELWLSGAGLLVVWIASIIVAPGSENVWKVAALTALGVSVLHGLIFWGVRRRQRKVRKQAIHEIREMLADVVKNQLAVIGMWLPSGNNQEMDMHIEGIKESIDHIEELVDTISEDSLRSWKTKYHEAIESTGALQEA